MRRKMPARCSHGVKGRWCTFIHLVFRGVISGTGPIKRLDCMQATLLPAFFLTHCTGRALMPPFPHLHYCCVAVSINKVAHDEDERLLVFAGRSEHMP